MLVKVAWQSLVSRKATVLLTVLSVAVSILVLLGVEHIRHEARKSFNKTISGVDLIVGARTGQLNLLLYSVFQMGTPTNNISWQSYQQLAAHPKVAWTIPISLGDAHRGYRVMGTTDVYFQHFRYGGNTRLSFAEGRPFSDTFDAVLGAEVAKSLQYDLGDQLVLAHGTGATSFNLHSDKPFKVVGILRPTGTPVDKTVLVGLGGIEAIHSGAGEAASEHLSTPGSITAFMVGLSSKLATFNVQRQVNNFPDEPLTAILPGVALTELWQMMAAMENVLRLVSVLVLFASLLGLCTMLLASMRERQRELAVLRAVGAGPGFVFLIIQLEVLLIVLVAGLAAVTTLWLGLEVGQAQLSERFGLFISANPVTNQTAQVALMITVAAFLMGLIPAVHAYRSSLQSGLLVRS